MKHSGNGSKVGRENRVVCPNCRDSDCTPARICPLLLLSGPRSPGEWMLVCAQRALQRGGSEAIEGLPCLCLPSACTSSFLLLFYSWGVKLHQNNFLSGTTQKHWGVNTAAGHLWPVRNCEQILPFRQTAWKQQFHTASLKMPSKTRYELITKLWQLRIHHFMDFPSPLPYSSPLAHISLEFYSLAKC